MKLTSIFSGLALVCLFVSGCASAKKQPPPNSGNSGNAGSAEMGANQPSAGQFLNTGYEPLEKWMDERFKVRYENMPLKMVFDQQPISDIRYKYVNLPENTPVFQLISPSISRREILQEIANYFQLDMRVDMADGKPNSVIVSGVGGRAYRPVSEAPPDPYFAAPGTY